MSNKLVSIIVPFYNSEEYLGACIESIINQTYRNLEIILVDDGSTDSSGQLCDGYAKKDVRISVIHKPNEGVSVSRNVGINNSNGEFIYFCDSDDILHESIIMRMVTIIEENHSDMAACSYTREKSQLGTNDSKELHIESAREFMKTVIQNQSYSGFLWNKMFKRNLLKSVIFDVRIKIFEDLLFCLNYLKNVKSVSVSQEVLYYYRDNANGACHQSFNENTLSGLLGREQILDILIENQIESDLIIPIYYELIYEYCVDFWKIKRISNYKFWKKVIVKGFNRFYKLYGENPEWTKKQKLIYIITKPIILFCTRKSVGN